MTFLNHALAALTSIGGKSSDAQANSPFSLVSTAGSQSQQAAFPSTSIDDPPIITSTHRSDFPSCTADSRYGSTDFHQEALALHLKEAQKKANETDIKTGWIDGATLIARPQQGLQSQYSATDRGGLSTSSGLQCFEVKSTIGPETIEVHCDSTFPDGEKVMPSVSAHQQRALLHKIQFSE